LVDAAIRASGETISEIDRNKRVLAAEYKLRQGVPEEKLDTRAQISVISVESLMGDASDETL
jgi:hypothetical protein